MALIDELLAEYSESHRNVLNKRIHYVCVPLIFWSIVGLLYLIPIPMGVDWMNGAFLALALVTAYYVRLSVPLSLVMFVFAMICMFSWQWLETQGMTIWKVALSVFVFAWIGQFYGHKVEGKKPSFLKDIQFLLIGPAWIAAQIFGIGQKK